MAAIGDVSSDEAVELALPLPRPAAIGDASSGEEIPMIVPKQVHFVFRLEAYDYGRYFRTHASVSAAWDGDSKIHTEPLLPKHR